MIRRRPTVEEEIADLGRRRVELNLKKQVCEVKEIMTMHPACVPKILTHLDSLGDRHKEAADAAFTTPENKGPQSRQAAAQAARSLKMKSLSHAAAAEGASVPELSDRVPSEYWTIGSLSASMMQTMCLAHLEPHSLSAANLRSLKSKSVPSATKGFLATLIEFITGRPPDFQTVGCLRYWPYLQALWHAKSLQRGRRGAELSLPPDWSIHGLYQLEVSEKSLRIYHRFPKQAKDMPGADFPSFDMPSELYIEFN